MLTLNTVHALDNILNILISNDISYMLLQLGISLNKSENKYSFCFCSIAT
jgi:hypothetical protein